MDHCSPSECGEVSCRYAGNTKFRLKLRRIRALGSYSTGMDRLFSAISALHNTKPITTLSLTGELTQGYHWNNVSFSNYRDRS